MRNVGWIFPGQGAQSARMGQKFMDRAAFSRVVDEIDAVTGRDVRDFITVLAEPELKRTDRAQLAIFAVSMGIDACLREHGLAPKFVAGHSLGHISALTSAGALTIEQAANLVAMRGSLMRHAGERMAGGMAVVQGISAEVISAALAQTELQVWPANLNLPEQTVVAGLACDLDGARAVIAQAGGKWIPLNVSGAFHSPLLAKEAGTLAEEIARLSFATPNCPIISNRDGAMLTKPAEIANDLAQHMSAQVRWTAVMDRIVAQAPEALIEVGPSKVLTGLMLRYAPEYKPHSTGVPALLDRAIGALKPLEMERTAACSR